MKGYICKGSINNGVVVFLETFTSKFRHKSGFVECTSVRGFIPVRYLFNCGMTNGLDAQGLVDTYPPDVPALVARKCLEGMQVVSMNLILTNET